MNNVILAAFLMGPWEILVILAMLLLLLAFAGALAWLIVYLVRRDKSQSPPPPPAPATEVILRRCPQCGKALQPDVPEGLCPACLLQRGLGTEGGVPPGTPPFRPPALPELAKLFPQLEILELIGQGGMGAVYKARQPALDRFVALKILAPRSAHDLDFAERFTREARALAKLSHPNIVGVYDFGVAAGVPPAVEPGILPGGERVDVSGSAEGSRAVPGGSVPPSPSGRRPDATTLNYFIMEFVDGPNLRQVERAGRLSPREALEIIPQICAALQFAHDEGIVHRDIKPENVLLDKKGRVKIADFGLAKILGQEPKDLRLTGARDVMGTPHYMAPEQVEKPQTVDHRADIYSLGVVFYEMLTGELPLGKFQPPSRKVQIDVRLDEVVLHALEKEPERRYQQASQVKTAVETITSDPATPEVRPAAPKQGEDGSLQSELGPRAGLTRSWLGFPFAEERNGQPAVLWVGVMVAWVVCWGVLSLGIPMAWVAGGGHFRRFISLPACLGLGQLLATAFIVAGIIRARWSVQAAIRARGSSRDDQTPPLTSEISKPHREMDQGLPRAVPAGPRRFSRAAIAGAVWIGLFFLNWLVNYTPPGWALRHLFRGSFLGNLLDLFVFMPLMLLGYAAVVGGSVMGAVALRQLRQARGQIRGSGLALFDLLFFPLLLANGWAAWLAWKVVSQISSVSLAGVESPEVSILAIAAFVLPALVLNTLLIRAAARMAKQFVHSPAPPASQPAMGTWSQVFKSAALRLAVVAIAQLALFETLEQVSGHWKESTQELWGIALAVATLGGLAWAYWPGYRLKQSWLFWGGGIVVSSLLLLGLDNFYAWHLRPNLGLYRESDWVAQHPGFQKQLRERVEQNRWQKPAIATALTVPPVVTQTIPASGTPDVDPALTELRVTFSKPMQDDSWSWTIRGEENFPEMTGQPHFLADRRTCVLPVKLEPGKLYATWLNSDYHTDFTDTEGRPAVPYLLIFETRK